MVQCRQLGAQTTVTLVAGKNPNRRSLFRHPARIKNRKETKAVETWGNLTDNEKQAIRSRARTFTDAEISERFAERDDKPVFRIFR